MKTTDRKTHSGFSLPLLMLSFGAATGLLGQKAEADEHTAPSPAPAMTQAGHTFWKHPDYDAVVEIWTDPQTGLRGRIASLNPADGNIRKMAGKILKKDEKQVSTADVLSFQGMEGDLHLHREGLKWTGSIYWPFRQKSYGVEVEPAPNVLHVHGFLLWLPVIGKSADLKPAAPPAPRTP